MPSDPSSSPAAPLAAGDVLDRYVILQPLGEGAMGTVYAAHDPQLDRKVALKVLRPTASSKIEHAAERLRGEARAMARLSHPNILQVHDVATVDDRLFLAMDLVDGDTLGAWLRAVSRGWREVVELFVAAGRGLAAAHAAGVVHRDFKPDNVLVGKDGGVWVSDFGLARREAESSSGAWTLGAEVDAGSADLDVRLTRTGHVVGTPAYVAPEQYAGGTADARADQFSFCVALYEGLYGVRPFRGDSAGAIASSIMRREIDDAPQGSDVPAWLRRVVVRGLHPDPGERYASMGALLDDLERRPLLRRRRRLIGAAVVVAVVATGGAWLAAERAETRACRSDALAGLAGSDLGGPSVAAPIDAYVTRWNRSAEDNCIAAKIRGDQSESLRAAREACLDIRRFELLELADALREAGRDAESSAVDAVHGLPRIEPCSAASLPAVPSDPEVRRDIARARVAGRLGRREAQADAEAALARAQAEDDPVLAAEAWLALGEVRDDVAAETALFEAIYAAEAGHDDHVAALAYVRLVDVIGRDPARIDEALARADDAAAAIERAEGSDALMSSLHVGRGMALLAAGRADEARTELEAVVDRGGAPDPDLARALRGLAEAIGDGEEARAAAVRALAAAEAVYGPDHPEVEPYRHALTSLL